MNTRDYLTSSPLPLTHAERENYENEIAELRRQVAEITERKEDIAEQLAKVSIHKDAATTNAERREATMRSEIDQLKQEKRDAELREGHLVREKSELVRQRDFYAGAMAKAVEDHRGTLHWINLIYNSGSAAVASNLAGLQQSALQWGQLPAGPPILHYNVAPAPASAVPATAADDLPGPSRRPGFGNIRRQHH